MKKNTQKTQYAELERGEIAIDEVSVSGDNFRKQFNEDALKELADNIAKVGVLEPIILRQNRQYKILVAGERRLRAAQMAGLATIPYRLLDLTEEQAREVMVLENLHRADLNPIEEATAFKDLLDSGGYTVDDIAERVDKSKNYVYRAIRLLDLPEEAQIALMNGEITTGHARHLLRIPQEEVKGLLKDIKRRQMTVSALKDQIKWQFGQDLKYAKWGLKDEYAGEQACSKCPFNTANQQSLFDEALETGRCTNRDCYEKKKECFAAEFVEKVKAKAEKAGMKFLEPKEPYQYDDYEEMDEELQEAYAAEIKKSPKKFALTVYLNSDEEIMFCVDKKLCKKINEERFGSNDDDGGYEESEEEKRERAVKEKIDQLIAEKLLSEVKKWELNEEEFSDRFSGHFQDWQSEMIAKTFGMKKLSLAEVLTLPATQIITLLCMLTNVSSWNFDTELGDLISYETTDDEFEKIREQAIKAVEAAEKK